MQPHRQECLCQQMPMGTMSRGWDRHAYNPYLPMCKGLGVDPAVQAESSEIGVPDGSTGIGRPELS